MWITQSSFFCFLQFLFLNYEINIEWDLLFGWTTCFVSFKCGVMLLLCYLLHDIMMHYVLPHLRPFKYGIYLYRLQINIVIKHICIWVLDNISSYFLHQVCMCPLCWQKMFKIKEVSRKYARNHLTWTKPLCKSSESKQLVTSITILRPCVASALSCSAQVICCTS